MYDVVVYRDWARHPYDVPTRYGMATKGLSASAFLVEDTNVFDRVVSFLRLNRWRLFAEITDAYGGMKQKPHSSDVISTGKEHLIGTS